jgi:5-methylcytosine-specific restriction protein B
VPGSRSVDILPRVHNSETEAAVEDGEVAAPALPLVSAIEDDDPILREVRHLIETDRWGGVLLQGPPGTGKTWYAREIAIKLTAGDRERIREIQFHPSYQYEDFVEGYVPRDSTGFALRDKHLLEMAAVARRTEGPVVLIIDEFSRTDPARVFGEVMTYMEGSLRDVTFSLPSGREVSIPPNLIFLATMNPEDRSVDEIDAAMDRRWAKVDLRPDVGKVRDFLSANGASDALVASVSNFANLIQEHIEIGHAFFRSVRDVPSLQRLWANQLQYLIRKRFRYDPETQTKIRSLWDSCLSSASGSAPSDADIPT